MTSEAAIRRAHAIGILKGRKDGPLLDFAEYLATEASAGRIAPDDVEKLYLEMQKGHRDVGVLPAQPAGSIAANTSKLRQFVSLGKRERRWGASSDGAVKNVHDLIAAAEEAHLAGRKQPGKKLVHTGVYETVVTVVRAQLQSPHDWLTKVEIDKIVCP